MAMQPKSVTAIMDLMSDYEPRSSEQISKLTGLSRSTVRNLLASKFTYEVERRQVSSGRVGFYSLKRHQPEEVQGD